MKITLASAIARPNRFMKENVLFLKKFLIATLKYVALQSYEKAVLAAADSSSYIPTYSPRPEWFKPGALGDSIILLQHNNNPNRDQILLLAKDSTHAFYCDMAD